MTEIYRIFGSEMSPYSVKVRSWFRFKGVPHVWLLRNGATRAEYERHAKIPIVPLVVTPDGQALQDSTPLLERLEGVFPEPSVHPDGPTERFLSCLMEEFGDEWGNKWMFHYRWARPVDQESAAGRIARGMAPMADEAAFAATAAQVRARMVDRVWFVGSNEGTAPLIEASFLEAIGLLDRHFDRHRYLFGDRPAFGDFGLWGQLYCAWTDPTAGALIEARAPQLLAWIQRMLWPRVEGGWASWAELAPTLGPVLTEQVGAHFMPWTVANAAAIAAGVESFRVELDGAEWTQKPQKYHARSLAVLREKYAAVPDRAPLDAILAQTGCLDALRA